MNKIKITQIKSAIGYKQKTKDTLVALGLKKLNSSVSHDDSPSIRGMIQIVNHLIKIEKV